MGPDKELLDALCGAGFLRAGSNVGRASGSVWYRKGDLCFEYRPCPDGGSVLASPNGGADWFSAEEWRAVLLGKAVSGLKAGGPAAAAAAFIDLLPLMQTAVARRNGTGRRANSDGVVSS